MDSGGSRIKEQRIRSKEQEPKKVEGEIGEMGNGE